MSPADSLKLGTPLLLLLLLASGAAALMSIALANNTTTGTTTTTTTTTKRQVTAGITATSSSSSSSTSSSTSSNSSSRLTTSTTMQAAHLRTEIPTETTSRNSIATSRSAEDPEITTVATSMAATSSISSSSSPIINNTTIKTSSLTTVKLLTTLTPMLPRQEKLVGLPIDNTTTTTRRRNGDSSLEANIDESTSEFPSSTLSDLPMTISATTTMTTTHTNLMLLGKSVSSSKSKNELVPGGAREAKPAHKVNNVNQGYFGGKLGSVLGKYSPYFEDGQQEMNMTARIGSTVMLDCVIGMLGNKTVTWSYRSNDVFRLLTVGRNAYSVDARISLHFKYPTNWRLRIQYATPRDSGLYECQVATYPPLVKKIHLLITAPILVIMDDSGRIKSGERHLKAGSELRLRCEARDVPERYNETVIWTRGDEILSEDVSENRTVEYLDGREIQVIVSTLLVERASPRHAGNYSCVVPEKAKTTVAVHVLNGELPAAVHDGNGVSSSVLNLWLIHLTVSYVFSR